MPSTLELEDREAMLSEASKLLVAWRGGNFLLAASALGEMIDAVPIPAADRLQLMLAIIGTEDVYDWRPRYWLDAELVPQRSISPFGRAAARAVHEDTVSCLEILAGLLREQTEPCQSVALGLLFEAVTADPYATLRLALRELFSRESSLFWNLAQLRPIEAAKLLGDSHADADHKFEKAFEELWHLTSSPPQDAAPLSLLRPTLAAAAVKLLPRAPNDASRSQLMIIAALGSSDLAAKEALEKGWSTVPDHAFWLGVEALPDMRLSLIGDMLQGAGIERDRAQILGRISPSVVPRQEWRELQDMLLAAAHDAALEVACAQAVEMLLYRAESSGGIEPFEKVAFQLARSPNGRTRQSLIYFAGSPVRIGSRSSPLRDLLFGELIEAETGTTLRTIVWKLLQSAPERPHVLQRLRFLVDRFGVDAIDSELARYWRIETAGAAKLLQEWRSTPEPIRPALPTIIEAIAH